MTQVTVQINGREYKITCENGQEHRLQQLSAYFDKHVSQLSQELGQIGDARLMLLAALTICDQLFESREHAEGYKNAADNLAPETLGGATRAIEAAAGRVESMANRLP